MVFFNWATMQMAAKIVYYGPGLCGKTTNLTFIYAKTSPGSRGEMVSLETESDRTLFFDLLPLEVGKVGGFRTRLQLYTVPGQVFYNTTRKLVLKGVDGVVFVADSQRPMAEANIESFRNLEENLKELGLDVDTIPITLQFNKRDLKNIIPVEELAVALDPENRWEHYEAVAVEGHGVFETLKAVTKLTLKTLRRRMVAQEGQPAAARPAVAPRVAFNPQALRAAAVEGLVSPPAAPVAVATATASAQPAVELAPAPPPLEEVPPPAEPAEEIPLEQEAAGVAATSIPEVEELAPADEVSEEIEEAPVEFATTSETAPPAIAQAEMRHVKVSSSLDILAELESLRKASTARPAQAAAEAPAGASSLDIDSLLLGSINSRQEVKRRVDENVGSALTTAHRCRVQIQLIGGGGESVREVSPIEVEIKRGERLRQLNLNLTVNLQGE